MFMPRKGGTLTSQQETLDVNEIFIVILPLYSRTDLPKETILECMARLAAHRLVVGLVLKLLLVISQQPKCAERLKAIELIGDIWSQHEIASLTTIDDSKGDTEFRHAKMHLIRRICLGSDRAEEFMPRLSTLSNSSGPLLSDAIFAIADLCRAEFNIMLWRDDVVIGRLTSEFGRFMHKMVACELNDFRRSLYTTVEGTSRLDRILETVGFF
ncbi:unnamed protein product [Toxocara canis]|uniref:RICTOR_N domain-containing protein n=1 Tax=Toxocara canis TaxID=6265 RepID=A0A183VE71_TOXCA|nr:unnamed protein product [Toxocara canis]